MEDKQACKRDAQSKVGSPGEVCTGFLLASGTNRCLTNALNSVEKDKDYEDFPAEAHLLLHILLRRVHVDDLIAQGPQDHHLQDADEARHSHAHVVVVHERLLIALADEFAHVKAHCPCEANWNHEGQQAETAHDGLCRDRGGRKITRE